MLTENRFTDWISVKQMVSKYGPDRIIKVADLHIKGLHWFASQLAESLDVWPEQLLLNIIIYAVLDDSKVSFNACLDSSVEKVSFDDCLDSVEKIRTGEHRLEFRGILFPVKQSKRAAELFIENKTDIMKQYNEIQNTIEKARDEQQ